MCPASSIQMFQVNRIDRPPASGQAYEEKMFSDRAPAVDSTARPGSQLPVSLYVSSDCRNCELVRTILEMNKVPYNQYLTDFNNDIQQQLLEISGSDKVPTVVIGEKVIDKLDRSSTRSRKACR